MKLRELLREDEDLGKHEPRLVTKREFELIKTTQDLAKVIQSGLGRVHDYESLKKLYNDLKSFTEFKFLNRVLFDIKEILDAYEKMVGAKEYRKKNIDKIKSSTAALRHAIMSSDRDNSKKFSAELKSMIDVLDGHIDLTSKSKSELKRFFTAESSIFGTMQLLTELGDDHYRQVINLDISKPLYTLVNFPFSKLEGKYDELHYIMYFMLHLTNTDEPREFKYNSDFRLFNKVANTGNESFEELKKLADEYLHDNKKSLIPRILELIKKVPRIDDANERRKKKIDTVYRGVGFGEDEHINKTEVIKQDQKTKFVATSISERAAKNFAFQKGHLEQDRRSSYGYIITYQVSEESILLDTQILDTVYGESEILIDATKAKVIGVKEV